MVHPYNLYNFEAPFKKYLIAGNAKPVSIKNYLSDFRHFAGWITNTQQNAVDKDEEISSLQELLTAGTIAEYKNYLTANHIPPKTINRRLSTMRKFCSFCITQGWIKENVAKKIGNVGSISLSDTLIQFQSETETQNTDLDDLNEFFTIINS